MATKIEKKTEPTAVADDTSADDKTYLAEVLSIYGVVGSGGSVRQCRVEIKETGRTLIRAVYGPIQVGDLLQLRECVRESRKLR